MRATIVACAAICFAPAALALDSGDIVVTALRGEVHVTMNGGQREVRVGSVLELPAIVRTGRDGAIDLRQGATALRVGPGTQLDFPAPAVPGGPIDRIQQPAGNVFYDVGKRGSRRLRIETPFLVAVVKGTQFNVAAGEAATTIALFEGQLEIRATDGGDVVDLVAGEIASRHRAEQDIDVMEMDATQVPPAPVAPSGVDGGEQAAPPPAAPHEESVAEGDQYLVQGDATPALAEPLALADARIDVSDTENFTAALGASEAPPDLVDVGQEPVAEVPGGDASPGSPSGAGDAGALPPVADESPGDLLGQPPAVDVNAGAGPDTGGGAVDPGAGTLSGAGTGGAPAVVDVDAGVDVSVPVADGDTDVDIGVDLNGDSGNTNAGNSGSGNNGNNGNGNNGNAYGHDKDNANGEAVGHDRDDDSGLLDAIVEDVVNLLDSSLKRPGRK